MRTLAKGDYVLATKYRDGDPYDGYAVGFYDRPLEKDVGVALQPRHLVVDGEGNQYRHTGFRRVERISEELGAWIVENRFTIEALTRMKPLNIWRYRRASARAELEGLASDPLVAPYISQIEREAAIMGRPRNAPETSAIGVNSSGISGAS